MPFIVEAGIAGLNYVQYDKIMLDLAMSELLPSHSPGSRDRGVSGELKHNVLHT
jgi:hypothetical protein